MISSREMTTDPEVINVLPLRDELEENKIQFVFG